MARGRRDKNSGLYALYTDIDGNESTVAPVDPYTKMEQDMLLERREARQELRTWINRWGRVSNKTNVLTTEQARLASRLLATFDRDS